MSAVHGAAGKSSFSKMTSGADAGAAESSATPSSTPPAQSGAEKRRNVWAQRRENLNRKKRRSP